MIYNANRRWVALFGGRLVVCQLGESPRPLTWPERVAWYWFRRVPRV